MKSLPLLSALIKDAYVQVRVDETFGHLIVDVQPQNPEQNYKQILAIYVNGQPVGDVYAGQRVTVYQA